MRGASDEEDCKDTRFERRCSWRLSPRPSGDQTVCSHSALRDLALFMRQRLLLRMHSGRITEGFE